MTPAQQAYLPELVRQYGAACRLSGNGAAVTEAYSAIVQARASAGNDVAAKQLNEAQQQTKLQAETVKQMSKLAQGGAFIKMMSLRGPN